MSYCSSVADFQLVMMLTKLNETKKKRLPSIEENFLMHHQKTKKNDSSLYELRTENMFDRSSQTFNLFLSVSSVCPGRELHCFDCFPGRMAR